MSSRSTLLSLTLGTLLFTGCEKAPEPKYGLTVSRMGDETLEEGFSRFQEYTDHYPISLNNVTGVAADFDGDGRVDLAIITYPGFGDVKVSFHRNLMPQKKAGE